MKKYSPIIILLNYLFIILSGSYVGEQETNQTKVPVIEDGQTLVVPAFEDFSEWIRQDLGVETKFDSDGNDQPDRVHVDITRPTQTESEGLKIPVIYEISPCYAGTVSESDIFWDVRHELAKKPPERNHPSSIKRRDTSPIISDSLVETWLLRGWTDPQNYHSISESKPLAPGKFYSMLFKLEPDDQIIPPGQQIGLMIFSGDREFMLRPDSGTKFTVDLDATTLTIPIVGGTNTIAFVQ